MKPTSHSTGDRRETGAPFGRLLLARFVRQNLALPAVIAAGTLMIGSPAWGLGFGAQTLELPLHSQARFDLKLGEALERMGAAIKSPGDDVVRTFVRPHLDSLDSLVPLEREAAPKAWDPAPASSEYREYGFSRSHAGIRWRLSLVESLGARS